MAVAARTSASTFASPEIAREALFARLRRRAAARDTSSWQAKAQLLLDECHPYQREFVADESKRVVALVGGRGGKTTGAKARLLRRMLLQRGAKCLFIAKSKPAAQDLIWDPLKQTIGKLGLKPRYHETRLRITFVENGSSLRLVGADDTAEIDKLRGQPFHDVVIDEAASHKPELLENLIFQVLDRRLGDYRGRLALIGTPGPLLRGLFYELTQDGSTRSRPYADRRQYPGWKGWSFHAWSIREAAPYAEAIRNAWEEALETKEREGWSDDNPIWLRETLGKWAADNTQMVFRYVVDRNQWDPAKDELGVAQIPAPKGELHHVYGYDLGASDPTAVEVFAWGDQDPEKMLYHVFEFHSREKMHTRALARLLLGEDCSADRPEGVIGKTGWPDAQTADIASLGGWILEDMANEFGIAIEPAEKKNRHDAIEVFNGRLIDGRVKILKGSVLEAQLSGLQWEIDEYGSLTKNKRQKDDAADAAIYAAKEALHMLSEIQRPPPPRPPTAFERVGHEVEEREAEALRPRGVYDELLSGGGYDMEEW